MAAAYRGALARRARALRALAGLLRAVPALAAGRHLDRLLAHAQTKSDAVGQVEWTISVDATINRAHQHAAGARHRPAIEDRQKGHASNPTKDWDDPGAG